MNELLLHAKAWRNLTNNLKQEKLNTKVHMISSIYTKFKQAELIGRVRNQDSGYFRGGGWRYLIRREGRRGFGMLVIFYFSSSEVSLGD